MSWYVMCAACGKGTGIRAWCDGCRKARKRLDGHSACQVPWGSRFARATHVKWTVDCFERGICRCRGLLTVKKVVRLARQLGVTTSTRDGISKVSLASRVAVDQTFVHMITKLLFVESVFRDGVRAQLIGTALNWTVAVWDEDGNRWIGGTTQTISLKDAVIDFNARVKSLGREPVIIASTRDVYVDANGEIVL